MSTGGQTQRVLASTAKSSFRHQKTIRSPKRRKRSVNSALFAKHASNTLWPRIRQQVCGEDSTPVSGAVCAAGSGTASVARRPEPRPTLLIASGTDSAWP